MLLPSICAAIDTLDPIVIVVKKGSLGFDCASASLFQQLVQLVAVPPGSIIVGFLCKDPPMCNAHVAFHCNSLYKREAAALTAFIHKAHGISLHLASVKSSGFPKVC